MHRSRLGAIVIDCQGLDIADSAAFWSAALGAAPDVPPQPEDAKKYRGLKMPADQPHVLIQQVDHPSRVHVDIETDDVDAEVRRLEALGATRVAQVKHWWVMQAPTGQRFCVVPAHGPAFAERANEWR
jgi:hypothetical protein